MGTCQYNNCKSYIDISTLNTTVNIIDQLNNDFMVVHEDYEHPLYG